MAKKADLTTPIITLLNEVDKEEEEVADFWCDPEHPR